MAIRVEQIGPEAFGAASIALERSMQRTLSVSSPRPHRLSQLSGAAGPAWSDEQFLDELRARDERIDAPAAARAALRALARGEADCVVTGQQPGLLGGNLLLASKLACAIALARHLSEQQERPVHPVYWCGADDSDFEETTRAWMWSLRTEPFRARLDAEGHEEGTRVGSIAGEKLAELERHALMHADPESLSPWDWSATLSRVGAADDFAQRMAAWAHELFPDAGLVIVDARSPRLRELGLPLFERYQRENERCTAALLAQRDLLRRSGIPQQLSDEALASGLFTLTDERRVKLPPDRIATAPTEQLSPSVLLRPLWQDQLLAPRAAILGPAELAYHAQLSPLYEMLGVRAAAALPRGFLHWLPAELLRELPGDLQALSAGEEERGRWLADRGLLDADRQALSRLQDEWRDALHRFAQSAPSADASVESETEQRLLAQLEKIRATMLPRSLQSRGESWRLLEAWSGLRGVPQERCYATAAALLRFGREDCAGALDLLGKAWLAALDDDRTPHFAALVGGAGS